MCIRDSHTSRRKFNIFDEGTDKKDTAQNTPKHAFSSEKIHFLGEGARTVSDPSVGRASSHTFYPRQAFIIPESAASCPRIPNRFAPLSTTVTDNTIVYCTYALLEA